MKLSSHQKIAMDKAVESASIRQLIIFGWWTLFNKRKAYTLIDNIEIGMSWKAAYERVQKSKPEGI